MLSLSVADCVPVCMFDPETRNFALIHSGWRGTYKKISNKAVSLLIKNKSSLSDIKNKKNPYGSGDTCYQIEKILIKRFLD